MEVLGVPPSEMLQNSPQVERYFVEHRASKSGNSDVQNFVERITMSPHRDVVYLPRYCSIRYPDDGGPPEIGPGVAKRSGHKRGVPASKPLLFAILQPRHGRFRQKDSQSMANLSVDLGAFRTTEEKVVSKDNELLLGLMLACLTWLPNERIKPYKAIQHGWLQNFSKRSTGSSQPRQRIRSMEVSQMVTYRDSGPIRWEKEHVDQSKTSTDELITAIPRRRKATGRSRTECISSRPITICDANTINWIKEEPIVQSTDSSTNLNDQVTRTNLQIQPSSYQTSWIPATKTKTVSPVTSLGSIAEFSDSVISSKGSDQTTRRVTLIYANAKNAGASEDSETNVDNATSEREGTRVRVGPSGVPYETNIRRRESAQTAHLNTSRRPYSEFYSVTEIQQCNTNAEKSGINALPTGPITSSVDSNGKCAHTQRTCRQIPSSKESGDQQYTNHAHTFQLAFTGGLALRSTNSGNNGQVIITKVLEPVNVKRQPRTAQAIRRNSELMTSSILNVNEPRLIGIGNRRHGLPSHVSDENARNDQQHLQACRGDQCKQGAVSWNPLTSPSIAKTNQHTSEAGLPDVASKPGREALSYSLNRVIRKSDGASGEDNGWAKHTHYQQLSAAQNNIILRRMAVPPQYRGTVVELRSQAHNMRR
ncbi:unnamed protein product [Dicrocoelium dendriticum]|nr:unnamed protein product [Dicrocoelium dendriticum]